MIVAAVVGCTPEAPETEQDPTDTDGLATEPLADESGGGHANIAGCLYGSEPGAIGYRYECALEYDLTCALLSWP